MKLRYVSIAALAAAVVAAPVFALADHRGNDDRVHSSERTALNVRISADGSVHVRGALVTQVSGDTITATTKWGNASIVWQVQTDSATEFLRKAGGRSTVADVEEGHTINFNGDLIESQSGLVVDADVVRNWSLNEHRAVFAGTVENVNDGDERFTLRTRGSGTITVQADDDTEFSHRGDSSTFAAIDSGDRVIVYGTFDDDTDVLDAVRIRLVTDVTARIDRDNERRDYRLLDHFSRADKYR